MRTANRRGGLFNPPKKKVLETLGVLRQAIKQIDGCHADKNHAYKGPRPD